MASRRERLPLVLSLALAGRGRSRLLDVLTILSVAISVALASSLWLASSSIDAELERTGRELAGEADLEISAGPGGMPERLLEQVGAVAGVAQAVPYGYAFFRIAEGPRRGDPLHVLGLDFTREQSAHAFAVEHGGVQISDPVRLLVSPDSVVVTARLMESMGLRAGDALSVAGESGRLELRVRGVLTGGFAAAFAGQVAAMDVYSLQTLLGREGWLDRIDVVLAPGLRDDPALRAQVEAALAERVAGIASVKHGVEQDSWLFRATGTLRLGVGMLVAIGVGLSCLICYAAVARSTERRMPEFAILRAAGLEARRVAFVVLIEAALLGGIGTVLGLALGSWFAARVTMGFETIAWSQGVSLSAPEQSASALLIGGAIGLLTALLGSGIPAWRSMRLRPLELLAAHRSKRSAPVRTGVWLLATTGAFALLWLGPWSLPPLARLAGLLIASLCGALALGYRLAAASPRRGARAIERLLPRLGALIGASLRARPFQTALAGSTIALILGAMIGVSVVLSSLSHTLVKFIDERYQDGMRIMAGDPFGLGTGVSLSAETVRRIRETPGVEALAETADTDLYFRGKLVGLLAQDFALIGERGRLAALSGTSQQIAADLARGQIAVSDGFARWFSISVGDEIALDTPRGARRFRVAGILRSFAGPTGVLYLDLAQFDRLWHRSGASQVAVWTHEPRDRLAERILERVGGEPLYILYGEELRQAAGTIIGRLSDLIWRIGLIIGFFGALGILNLLSSSLAERRQELALIRAAGFTRAQLAGLIAVDALLVGVAGTLAGLGLGLVLAGPMLAVVEQTMGWLILRASDAATLLALALGVIGMTALSALVAALLVRRLSLPESLSLD